MSYSGGTGVANALGSVGERGVEGNSSEELMTQESPEVTVGRALADVAGNVGPWDLRQGPEGLRQLTCDLRGGGQGEFTVHFG